MSTASKPKRRAIPLRIKRELIKLQNGLCACGCGRSVSAEPRTDTHFNHTPPLALRAIDPNTNEWVPGQWSISHLNALRSSCHRIQTSGQGATTAGTDIGAIKKQRKRERINSKPKYRWPKRKLNNLVKSK